ncbi:hypothetical protein BDA96_10G134700 [Sorghum bicolor]|uniref:Uncharacterized protein n=2 Tax=Sorghum bicolor TaxID=4558 RepID=A0A921U0T9_SORBI|nr:hypothetical protein BDA96_10G134700 [Sorghum bicolor]OQU76206.1 hypothetical protein SORBI_3010G110332 [Sorghum bicolor]
MSCQGVEIWLPTTVLGAWGACVAWGGGGDSWPFLLLVSKKRARIRKQPRDSNDEDLNAGHDVLEPVGDGVNFW